MTTLVTAEERGAELHAQCLEAFSRVHSRHNSRVA
jgi:hypothetical protein